MAKQLNKNLIVILTIAAFGVILALSVVMLQRIERSDPKYFVELAERTAGAEKWQEAAIFYNRAWELSNDAQYLVSVGDMLLEDGEVGRALGSWEQALLAAVGDSYQVCSSPAPPRQPHTTPRVYSEFVSESA